MPKERHARLPDSVLLDPKLAANAKVVYAGLSRHAFKAGLVYIGQRRLAELLGLSQPEVSRGVDALSKSGYITVTNLGAGKRNGYQLTSNVFQPRDKTQNTRKTKLTEPGKARLASGTRQALDDIIGATEEEILKTTP